MERYIKLEKEVPEGAFSIYDMEILVPEVEKLTVGEIYLEIGVDKGRSLSVARKVANPGVAVYGVDIRPSPRIRGTKFIRSDSVIAGRKWRSGHVSLLFIDGDHSYEGCISDIYAWLRHARPKGTILFHDCDSSSPGVVRAVSEFVSTHWDMIVDFDMFRYPEKRNSMARIKLL